MLRAHDDVDLVIGKELAERAALGIVCDLDRLEERRCARLAMPARMIDGAFGPAHGGEVDIVVVRENAADPDRCRHGVERNADALAGDVLGRANAGLAVDIDIAVTEHPRGKHRQRHEGVVAAREPADIFGAGEFRGVELLLAAHAIEQVARRVDRDEVEIDILDFDISGPQRLGAVVEAAGKRQSGHVANLARMMGSNSNECVIRAFQLVQYGRDLVLALARPGRHTGACHERRRLQRQHPQISQDARRYRPA